MKKITANEVAEYIINSDCTRLEDGLYYVHINEDGEFVHSASEGETFTTEAGDISEWEDDESPERFYDEFETTDNKDFMYICEDLADQINDYFGEEEAAMTKREFVENLFNENRNGNPELMDIETAENDLNNFRLDGWDIPEDLTAEEYAEIWNNLIEIA